MPSDKKKQEKEGPKESSTPKQPLSPGLAARRPFQHPSSRPRYSLRLASGAGSTRGIDVVLDDEPRHSKQSSGTKGSRSFHAAALGRSFKAPVSDDDSSSDRSTTSDSSSSSCISSSSVSSSVAANFDLQFLRKARDKIDQQDCDTVDAESLRYRSLIEIVTGLSDQELLNLLHVGGCICRFWPLQLATLSPLAHSLRVFTDARASEIASRYGDKSSSSSIFGRRSMSTFESVVKTPTFSQPNSKSFATSPISAHSGDFESFPKPIGTEIRSDSVVDGQIAERKNSKFLPSSARKIVSPRRRSRTTDTGGHSRRLSWSGFFFGETEEEKKVDASNVSQLVEERDLQADISLCQTLASVPKDVATLTSVKNFCREDGTPLTGLKSFKHAKTQVNWKVDALSHGVINFKNRYEEIIATNNNDSGVIDHLQLSSSAAFGVSHFWWKFTFHIFVNVWSLMYAFLGAGFSYSPDEALTESCWVMLIIAKYSAMAIIIYSTILYLTMNKRLLTLLSGFGPFRRRVFDFVFDGTISFHIESGAWLVVQSIVHSLAHILCTPDTLSNDTAEHLNELVKCVDANNEKYLIKGLPFAGLAIPACPFTGDGYIFVGLEAWLTMPLMTGLILLIYIAALGATARKSVRKQNFELFFYVHIFIYLTWPLIVFFHGVNQWVGIGIPIVFVSFGWPWFSYMVLDFFPRLIQCLKARQLPVSSAVMHCGLDNTDNVSGAIISLFCIAPRKFGFLRRYWKPGMVAWIRIPEVSFFQWHPFTIASSGSDQMRFCIMNLGDWTGKLAKLVDSSPTQPDIERQSQNERKSLELDIQAFHKEMKRQKKIARAMKKQEKWAKKNKQATNIQIDHFSARESLGRLSARLRLLNQKHRHGDLVTDAVGMKQNDIDALGVLGKTVKVHFPKISISIDAPYRSPLFNDSDYLLCRSGGSVVVYVACGIGITPFVAMVDRVIERIESRQGFEADEVDENTQIHLYWMSRRVDDFLLMLPAFTKMQQNPKLLKIMHLHLHLTTIPNELLQNNAAFLFRWAVKLQNELLRSQMSSNEHHVPFVWLYEQPLDILPLRYLAKTKESDEAPDDLYEHAIIKRDDVSEECSSDDDPIACKHSVVFGRPDLPFEIYLLGALNKEKPVVVHVCGNDVVQEACQRAVRACNDLEGGGSSSRFSFRCERFGE